MADLRTERQKLEDNAYLDYPTLGDFPEYDAGKYGIAEIKQAIANAEAAANINPADFGTKITDSTMPPGGVGNLGWLSAIWKLITDRLPTLVSGRLPVNVSNLSAISIEPQLTTPGQTTTSKQLVGYKSVTFSVKVANINTSVTLRFEGSNNNIDWFNLSVNNSDTTITANGAYGIEKTNCNCEYVRANFVSESGGTNATIDIIVRMI